MKRVNYKAIDQILGNHLETIRLNAHLTRVEFATHLGVSSEQIFEYERGCEPLPAELLQRVINLFDIDSKNFFDEVKEDVELCQAA